MIPNACPVSDELIAVLREATAEKAVAMIGGLLTVPRLQANAVRIEVLAHLAMAHCTGNRPLDQEQLEALLNLHLGESSWARLEDPPEDVFITNIETPVGNRLIMQGLWESADYYLQVLLDVISNPGAPSVCIPLVESMCALLTLADSVASRLGLQRWLSEESSPSSDIDLTSIQLMARARAVTFTPDDLAELGIDPCVLEPYILEETERRSVCLDQYGNSHLERHPLARFGDTLILALPNAVSAAIRMDAISRLASSRHLGGLASTLEARQSKQIEETLLNRFRGIGRSLQPPEPKEAVPSMRTWLLSFDSDKYLQIVYLCDELDEYLTSGLAGFRFPSRNEASALEKYIAGCARACQESGPFTCGVTLLVPGGLGRGLGLGLNVLPDSWIISSISLPDVLRLVYDSGDPVQSFLKFLTQRTWAEGQGVRLVDPNGDYNGYCWWREEGYRIIPRDIPVRSGAKVFILSGFVKEGRERLRSSQDRHLVPTIDGEFVSVLRYGSDSYFPSSREKPTYVHEERIRQGSLAGVVETSLGVNWLTVYERDGSENARRIIFTLWSGLLEQFDRILANYEGSTNPGAYSPLEIRLDFTTVAFPDRLDELECAPDAEELRISLVRDRRLATLHMPRCLFRDFQNADNSGERILIRHLVLALAQIHGQAASDEQVEQCVESVLETEGSRILHLFSTNVEVQYFLANHAPPARFLFEEDLAHARLGRNSGCVKAVSTTALVTESDCIGFLNCLVEKIWREIRSKLQELDRAWLLEKLLLILEGAMQDRDHWRRTARAVLSLYPVEDDPESVAAEREAARSQVSLAARTLAEMANCESPVEGGSQPSSWEVDALLAKTVVLLETAMDSDSIHYAVQNPQIQLHSNGEYSLDRDFLKRVVAPFLASHFREEYRLSARQYEQFYDEDSGDGSSTRDDTHREGYLAAFETEYGISVDQAFKLLGAAVRLAIAAGSVVAKLSLRQFHEGLTEATSLQPATVSAFIDVLSLTSRPRWDKVPEGHLPRDLYPWIFRRRLSLAVRPILRFGKAPESLVMFGIGSLMQSFGYLMGQSEEGHLPVEFFSTEAMRTYTGKANFEKGLEFARNVASKLTEAGWKTRCEIQMTELEAPEEMGDIDVLAWHADRGVVVIECKRLQLAKTPREVAEICRRFRGEAEDELFKHLRRMKWIRSHVSSLKRIVGFVPDVSKIDDRLVTSAQVPMQFVEGLPLDTSKIGPLDSALAPEV